MAHMMAYEEGFLEYNGDNVAGSEGIHGANGGWTVWALSGDQRIPHVLKAQRDSIHISYPHVGMDSYLVVRQSQLGEETTLFGCQIVPIRRDKYVIRLMSLLIHMVAAAVDTL
jgi:hypothetical protein